MGTDPASANETAERFLVAALLGMTTFKKGHRKLGKCPNLFAIWAFPSGGIEFFGFLPCGRGGAARGLGRWVGSNGGRLGFPAGRACSRLYPVRRVRIDSRVRILRAS